MDTPGRPDDVPDLTPEDDARLQALLGDLRADEAVPPPVAARLDDRLDELVAAHAPARRPAHPTWVRRHAGRLLVAAAAVVAVAVAGPPIVHQLQEPTGASGSSASTADSGGSGDAGGLAATSRPPAADVPRLRSDRFRAQAAAVARRPASLTSPYDAQVSPCGAISSQSLGVRVVPVLLDGDPAELVIEPVHRGTRLVRAVSCSGRVLAQARVPK